MKKITAALLCVMLVISTSVTAFGATKNDVKEKIETAVAFAFDGNYSKNGYDVSASKNLYILAQSGADISKGGFPVPHRIHIGLIQAVCPAV